MPKLNANDYRNIAQIITVVTFLALFYFVVTQVPITISIIAGTPITIGLALAFAQLGLFVLFWKKII